MTDHSLTFDAVREDKPGPKWAERWARSGPAYMAWFRARGGEKSPSREECEAALARHMPELVPVHRALTRLAGGGDLEARFLSTWCPPSYLGGCAIAALADEAAVRLVRNYDLSPNLNEGLLMRTEWTGTPVMGMIEFLWGLSDGINGAGLSVALAYGGRQETARGFGVTTIMRYIMETCETVAQALAVLRRVPSHMAYNVTLADRHGRTATAELRPGGGMRLMPAIATNHQHGAEAADRAEFTATRERYDHLKEVIGAKVAPGALSDAFLEAPLYRTDFAGGFGTLFTAVYDSVERTMVLRWPDEDWVQSLNGFSEGQRVIRYGKDVPVPAWDADDAIRALLAVRSLVPRGRTEAFDAWADEALQGRCDWARFGRVFVA